MRSNLTIWDAEAFVRQAGLILSPRQTGARPMPAGGRLPEPVIGRACRLWRTEDRAGHPMLGFTEHPVRRARVPSHCGKIAYRTRARSGMSACPSFGPAMMLPVAAPYCAGVSNGRDEDPVDKFRHSG
jgi:hypothetical protein